MADNCTIVKMIPKDNLYGHVITKGFVIYKHWHNDLEFLFLESGELTIEIDTTDYIMEQGQCMIINPMTAHAFKSTTAGSVLWCARVSLTDMYSCIGSKSKLKELFETTLILVYDKKLKELMRKLIYANYREYNDLYAALIACEMLIEISSNRRCIHSEIYSDPVEISDHIVRMQEFIDQNISKGITLSMVADHLGFSSSYCSRYIKQKTNLNYLEYLNSVRMREAENLLRGGEDSVIEVAYKVGFSSIQSFNRTFKKHRGVTPTEYRSSLRTKTHIES